MRGRVLQPGRRQAVQVPGRPPRGRLGLPSRLEQLALRKSHQDRIQRAGPQPDLECQLVAVAPRQRIARERPENVDGLARRAAVSDHGGISLPMSRNTSNPALTVSTAASEPRRSTRCPPTRCADLHGDDRGLDSPTPGDCPSRPGTAPAPAVPGPWADVVLGETHIRATRQPPGWTSVLSITHGRAG